MSFISIEQNPRFGFGKNWQAFLSNIDEQRVERAKESLTSFLGITDLRGKTFVDVGSGSGLFSYAAFLLGAKRIVSFDYDKYSVAATAAFREQAGTPAHWQVLHGSALDPDFLAPLGRFDVVYSWGVLHHTGSMWQAVDRTVQLTAPKGTYCIALYNRVEGRFGSRFWLKVKKRYNSGSVLTRKLIEWAYIFMYYFLLPLSHLRSPFRVMREYGSKRGMHYRRDVTDWVGGYPYEYASPEEVFAFMKQRFPKFRLENLRTVSGIGNNQFLFISTEPS